jgi:Sulfatase
VSAAAPQRRVGPWREAALLAAALLASELHRAASQMLEAFGRAKVLSSLDQQAGAVAGGLVTTGLVMLATVAALTLLTCRAWVALSRPARAALIARLGGGRAARVAVHAVATLVFVNLLYSVQQFVTPGSSLRESWLAMASGALDRPVPILPTAYLAPTCAALAVAALIAASLVLSRPLRRRAALAAGGLLALLAGWSWATAPGPLRPFTAPGNVVLLGLDSFQDNRLALRRDGQPVAPRIAGFLEQSFRFENAWTPLARTYPSWIALLTGRWPTRNGVRFNLAPDAHAAADNRYLGDELAAAGYATLHATDETRFSIIRERHGFQSLLHPQMGAADFVLASLFDFSLLNLARRTAAGEALFPALRDNRASPSYDPLLWTRHALAAVDELPRDRPALIAVHLCGNHWPFTLGAPWSLRSPDPVEACMSLVDDQVGVLLDAFESAGLLERSVTVMLSDHGDGWRGPGDKLNSHGDDFSSAWANRIVLGLRAPGVPAGRSDALVRSIDLHPTLLELLGRPVDSSALDGRSLVPLLRGQPDPPRPLYAESELDKRHYSLRQLVERNARWYEVDPSDGLVHIRDEGCAEFLAARHYMLIEGDLRLVAVPYQQHFDLLRFDVRAPQRERPADDVGAAERAAMLRRLAEHFALPADELLVAARADGFFGPSLASR